MANRSARGLDSVNFFIAAVQTAFGAFVTVYLVKNQWSSEAIGFALTVSTMSSLISQMPAGAWIDTIEDKRRPVMLGTIGIGIAALFLCMTATRPAVYLALAVQGLASALIGPGIASISLAMAGQAGLSERIGRNARFASIGNGLAAGAMGIAGSYLPVASVFFVAAALVLPALLALSLITHKAAPRLAALKLPGEEARIPLAGMRRLLLNQQLEVFAACVVLFFAASAALGPGLAGQVTRREPQFATLVVAITILLPQAIVAGISPWIGRKADADGRRPLLLIGWGLLPILTLLYAAVPSPEMLMVSYLLNAISAAIFGVLLAVVTADLTRDTGGFNLALGALGVAIAVGASLSTSFAGLVAGVFSPRVAAVALALVGLCGWLLVWIAMPETRPRVPVATAGGVASV